MTTRGLELNSTAETDDTIDVTAAAKPPAIGVIALKFVASLTVIVALFALAWSR